MKANSLSISIPNKGCNKNCPYCVSKMTGYINSDIELMKINLPLVRNIAKRYDIANVIFTSKGEPLLNMPDLSFLSYQFKNEFILELQTNGKRLGDLFYDRCYHNFQIIAISVDSITEFYGIGDEITQLKEEGKLVRITFCVHDKLIYANNKEVIRGFLNLFDKFEVDQISFRKLTIPIGAEKTSEAEWIRNHTKKSGQFFTELDQYLKTYGFLLRKLDFGAMIYDLNGLSVTWFDYCIQEQSRNDDIRSLIYQEDGHLYTHWGRKASILF